MNGVSEEVVSFEHNFVVFILLHDTFKILISEVILKKKLKKKWLFGEKKGYDKSNMPINIFLYNLEQKWMVRSTQRSKCSLFAIKEKRENQKNCFRCLKRDRRY